MLLQELRPLLSNLLSDAESVTDIAKPAEKHRKPLGGHNPYADRFHAAVVKITAAVGKVRPHLDGLDLDPADRGKFDQSITALTDPKSRAKEKAEAVRTLRMVCDTAIVPKADGMTASPVPSTESVLPMAVVKGTKGNLEQIVTQINGCYEHQWFDACSVMIRKLAEILIIAVYEKNGVASEVKDKNDNYLMLADLLANFRGKKSVWHLGRETIPTLEKMKERGDRSAHNRTYLATKQDVDGLISGLRVTVPELIEKADYRYPRKL